MHRLGTLDFFPIEIVLLIMRHVGWDELRRTLAISKPWFHFAAPIVCERITIRLTGPIPYQLDRAVGARYLGITKDSLRHLKLFTAPFLLTGKDIVPEPEVWRERVRCLWTDMLPYFNRINTLHISEQPGPKDGETTVIRYQMRPTKIDASQVACLLETLNGLPWLSSIHLDMCSPRVTIGSCPDTNLCAILARLMARLDHVKIRMPSICPEIFSLYDDQASSRAKPRAGPLTIIVNCSISSKDVRLMSKCHSCDCRAWKQDLRTPVSFDAMVQAARFCLPRLHRIQQLRILHHNLPGLKTIALDVVDNNIYKVPDKEWTSLGKLIDKTKPYPSGFRSRFTDTEIRELEHNRFY